MTFHTLRQTAQIDRQSTRVPPAKRPLTAIWLWRPRLLQTSSLCRQNNIDCSCRKLWQITGCCTHAHARKPSSVILPINLRQIILFVFRKSSVVSLSSTAVRLSDSTLRHALSQPFCSHVTLWHGSAKRAPTKRLEYFLSYTAYWIIRHASLLSIDVHPFIVCQISIKYDKYNFLLYCLSDER